MRRRFRLAAFVLLAVAVAPVAARAEPTTPAPTPATPAPAQADTPSLADLEASREAVAQADIQRIFHDRAYAATMLGHLDRLVPLGDTNVDLGLAVDNMRLFALVTLERPEEIRTTVDRTLERRPTQGGLYGGPWMASIAIQDFDRAVATVETASRNVPGIGWPELRSFLGRESVGPVLSQLHQSHQEDKRVRLAQALFRIGWPGGGDLDTVDYLRSILIEDRLRAHDGSAAAEFAAGITTPGFVLPMIVQTRYDPVLAPGRDRLDLLRESLAGRERDTADALTAAPHDQRRVLDRAQYLRGLGRDAEALALLAPFTRDIRATVAGGEQGMWLINEAAYAQLALGHGDEAIALMRRLGALPIAANPALIGPAINRAEILWHAGHFAEALDQARGLDTGSAQFANDYGKAWIAAGIVCALAGLHREAEAPAQMERLRGWGEANPAALARADLCLGDDEAAAAVLVHQLQGDDPEAAVLALQDYTLSRGEGQQGLFYDRLKALRDRPAVRDALGRVGRVLSLPLARTSLGGEF